MPVVGPSSEYLRAKTCPLLASSTASTSPEYERAGAARASRVEFFDSGMPVPAERARAVPAGEGHGGYWSRGVEGQDQQGIRRSAAGPLRLMRRVIGVSW